MSKFAFGFTFVAAMVCLGAVAVYTARAADEPSGKTAITGVLIDQHCGENMMKKDDPEKAAAAHKKACAIKCADSGYAVIVGKKEYKFDDKGNQLAKDYLAKEDSKMEVSVQGEVKDDTIAVTAINPAPSKG